MVSVTIVGSGITGLTIASQLPADYKVTVLAEYLPGDAHSNMWASPWAGGCWVGVHNSSPRDRKLQLQSIAGLFRYAKEFPDAGLTISTIHEIMEYGSPEDIWYAKLLPGYRLLDRDELPPRALFGVSYQSVIISPPVFLPWLRRKLEARGVQFHRARIESLAELRYLKDNIVINATGASARTLEDVKDDSLVPYWLQSLIIKSEYHGGYIYRGLNGFYFNMFGRGDGTAYMGGIKDLGSPRREISEMDRSTILARGHELLPALVPSKDPKDYQILYDIGTTYHFRPQDKGGVRIEAEKRQDQNIVHAYGQEAGGYCYSFGVAREVTHIVGDVVHELPPVSRL